MTLTPERLQKLAELERRIGIHFASSDTLSQALTHTSYVSECEGDRRDSNQRLEFLGDAILGMVVSACLFERYPDLNEGELTKIKAIAVSEPILSDLAAELGLGEFLLLGRGEETSGGRERASLLADAYESLIGAIYLEYGLATAQRFILDHLTDGIITIAENGHAHDSKSALQELVQEQSKLTPSYHVIEESGPDHEKEFVVEVRVEGKPLGTGRGSSKKEAQQVAAAEALGVLAVSGPQTHSREGP